jgi:hypothetical protein
MFMPEGESKGADVVVSAGAVAVVTEPGREAAIEAVVVLVDVATGRVVDGFSLKAWTIAGSTRAFDSSTWWWNHQ